MDEHGVHLNVKDLRPGDVEAWIQRNVRRDQEADETELFLKDEKGSRALQGGVSQLRRPNNQFHRLCLFRKYPSQCH